MKLCDVNVLVYAHRPDASPDHQAYAEYVKSMCRDRSSFAISENVLSGFLRVVTNHRIFKDPTPTDIALRFCRNLLGRPQAVVLRPGSRNWEIFSDLCSAVNARGNLVADAWQAALAIEYDCEWISTDGDFARFPKLRWRHPLA